MKILHITATVRGGAGRAATRLHKALLNQGHDSALLTFDKEKTDIPNHFVEDPQKNLSQNLILNFERLYHDKILINRSNLSNTLFSMAFPGPQLADHPLIQKTDIINLHWITHYLTPSELIKISSLTRKQVVWTMHDEWAYTGGCHYTAGCDKFLTNCSTCPQLINDDLAIPQKTLELKLKLIAETKIGLVSPSKWLLDRIKKSPIFKKKPIRVIPYSIELEKFKINDKSACKKQLNLSSTKFWILFIADNIDEKRKGFLEFKQALNFLKPTDIGLIIVGDTWKSSFSELPFEIIFLGKIFDDAFLNQVYSAADVVALPSLEDNLPNIILESLASGTPLVSFPVGGMLDHLHPPLGYLAKDLTPKSFAMAIQLAKESITPQDAQTCRLYAEETFSHQKQARSYLEFYNELLEEKNKTPNKTQKKLPYIGNRKFFYILSGGVIRGIKRQIQYYLRRNLPEWVLRIIFYRPGKT